MTQIKRYQLSYILAHYDIECGRYRLIRSRTTTFDTSKHAARRGFQSRRKGRVFVYRVKEVKRK